MQRKVKSNVNVMLTLKEFVVSMIQSFLGPCKSIKAVVEDKSSFITNCPLVLFQLTNLKDPLASVIEETLYAHHEAYGCATLSLLAMWYFWNEEFQLLLNEGFSISDILTYAQNALDYAIALVPAQTIDPKSLFVYKKSKMNLGIVPKSDIKIPIGLRYSSRHFSPSQVEESSEETKEIDLNCLTDLISKIDHTDDDLIASLLLNCWKEQLMFAKIQSFRTDGLIVCPIISPSCKSTVVDGLVIKSNLNPIYHQSTSVSGNARALIVTGSITYEYVHLGFSPKVSTSVQCTAECLSTSEKDDWVKKCCDVLLQLSVKCLLVKENIAPEILSFCCSHDILVFSNIPWKTLKILCQLTENPHCTYLPDCNEKNVLTNILVEEWKLDSILAEDMYYKICVSSNQMELQTVVMCHPCQMVLENQEHQFWHSASRLKNILQTSSALPGSGETEKHCFESLNHWIKTQKFRDAESRTILAVANGFLNYYNCISAKIKEYSFCNNTKLDETSSKIQCWKSAMALVQLTIRCDYVLINGAETGDIFL